MISLREIINSDKIEDQPLITPFWISRFLIREKSKVLILPSLFKSILVLNPDVLLKSESKIDKSVRSILPSLLASPEPGVGVDIGVGVGAEVAVGEGAGKHLYTGHWFGSLGLGSPCTHCSPDFCFKSKTY